jgi:hypothetical protein
MILISLHQRKTCPEVASRRISGENGLVVSRDAVNATVPAIRIVYDHWQRQTSAWPKPLPPDLFPSKGMNIKAIPKSD